MKTIHVSAAVTDGEAVTDGQGEPESVWSAAPAGAAPLPGSLEMWLAGASEELVALRRQIHMHPELSGNEFETANLVAHELKALGLDPWFLPRGNGVVCDIGSGDWAVALRADMDALALTDTKDVVYRSQVDGVCHACGHDVHTAILLGVARALVELEADKLLPGRVRLIFQPSEETMPSGAPEVIEADGLVGVKSIFALHCYPQFPVGYVGVRSGPLTAAADAIEVRLSGPGGHTARPHLTADLVQALARVITEVPARLNRAIDPRHSATLVFGAVHAGEAHNTIPMSGLVRGTMRVANVDTWHKLSEMVPAAVRDVVAGLGVEVEIEYRKGFPPVVNDRGATAIVEQAAATALGPAAVREAEMSMGGEDFAFYAEMVPGSMFRLGVGKPGEVAVVDIHRPAFDVDERAIACGVRVFVHTALLALHSGPA